MNSRSKITTIAMAIALTSGVGFLHAQGQGGSSGSVGARDQTNDPLSNNNNQMQQQTQTQTGTAGSDMNNAGRTGQAATSSQNNGNNNTTETWQDPNRRTTTDNTNRPMNDNASNNSSMDNYDATAAGSNDNLPARADRN